MWTNALQNVCSNNYSIQLMILTLYCVVPLVMNSIGGISGLHKLWRSRKHESPGGSLSSEVLPYLGSYADTMIEGMHVCQEFDTIVSEC
jgi:hypothetical protein